MNKCSFLLHMEHDFVMLRTNIRATYSILLYTVNRKTIVLTNTPRTPPHCKSGSQKALKKCSYLGGGYLQFLNFFNESCIYLRCSTWWLDIHLHSEVITPVKLVNISVSSYNHFFCVWWLKSTLLANFWYIWPLNNIGLNCTSPLTHRFFSMVNATVLDNLLLVESVDTGELWIWGGSDIDELQIRRTDYNLYLYFPPCGGSAPLTLALFKGQLYSVQYY